MVHPVERQAAVHSVATHESSVTWLCLEAGQSEVESQPWVVAIPCGAEPAMLFGGYDNLWTVCRNWSEVDEIEVVRRFSQDLPSERTEGYALTSQAIMRTQAFGARD